MWSSLKERFLKFDTLHGIYKIPLGILVVYMGLFHIQWILQALAVFVGTKAVMEGLQNLFTNPVAQKLALNTAVINRAERLGVSVPPTVVDANAVISPQ